MGCGDNFLPRFLWMFLRQLNARCLQSWELPAGDVVNFTDSFGLVRFLGKGKGIMVLV